MSLESVFTWFCLGMFSLSVLVREGQMCFFFFVSFAHRYMMSCWCCVDSLTTCGAETQQSGDVQWHKKTLWESAHGFSVWINACCFSSKSTQYKVHTVQSTHSFQACYECVSGHVTKRCWKNSNLNVESCITALETPDVRLLSCPVCIKHDFFFMLPAKSVYNEN